MLENLHKLFQLRVFRYLIAAGIATVVDIIVYTLVIKFIFIDQKLSSLIISYSCGLVTNFLLSKYYVFHESNLKSTTQFTRFTIVAMLVFIANYYMIIGLEFFIPFPTFFAQGFRPIFFRGLSASIVAILSFFTHKFFSFKV